LKPPVLLALLLALTPALADEVILADGTSLRGELVGEKDPQVLRIAIVRAGDRVVIEIPRAQVRFVRQLNDAEERLSLEAEHLLLIGDTDRALATLRDLVKRRPKDARAHRELGFALLLANRAGDALAPLQEACALDPIDVEAHLQLAQALDGLGKSDGAIDAYRKATRIGPRHVAAWLSLARLLLARGQGADRIVAFDALRRAAGLDPPSEAAALEWASAILQGGAGDQAARTAEARRILAAFAKRVPTSALAGRALAQLDAVAGRYGDAAARLDELTEKGAAGRMSEGLRERLAAELALYRWLKDPSAADSPAGTEAAAVAKGDLPAAERRLALLLEARPEDARLMIALARVLIRAEQHPSARLWLERAARVGLDELAEDALLLQQALVGLEKSPATLLGEAPSLPRCDRLVRLLPWLEAAHATKGRALLRLGRFHDAADAYVDGAKRVNDPEGERRLGDAARAARKQAATKVRNREN
jgi:Flp pilus assembly protein TadD